VRTWSYPNYTRVVVELSRKVNPQIKRLAADPAARRLDRLYLDLDGIWVGRRYEEGIPVEDGLLRGVRLGQNTLKRSRLVIDLDRYGRHRLLVLESPHRVVVDIYSPKDGRAKELRPRSHTRAGSRLSMPLRDIRRVVVDPGHGGSDPGAIGVGGLREKDVNLRLSRKLATELRKRGFDVVMTRERDATLDLEERTAIAESAAGDLFVSIHANAARRSRARGLEIYYLDADHERHNLDVAARENGVTRGELDSLQRTLAKFRVAEASLHSERLAHTVHDEVVEGFSGRYRDMPDLGVKTGPFYVLFLASMPAILVETGFVTNRRDAALLKNDGYLDVIAKQIAEGLEQYRDTELTLADRSFD